MSNISEPAGFEKNGKWEKDRRAKPPPRHFGIVHVWRHKKIAGGSVVILEENYEAAKKKADEFVATQSEKLFPGWGTTAYEFDTYRVGDVIIHLP